MISIHQHISGRRLRFACATSVLAVLGVLAAAPAAAQPVIRPPTGHTYTPKPPASPPVIAPPAVGGSGGVSVLDRGRVGPTPSLTKVANAFTVGIKSVSMLVKLPAGLNLTVPVKASILVNGVWTIQDYVNSTGNHWFYNLDDKDAQVRTESVTVALQEITPGGQSFSFTWPVRIEPLYDISIGSLHFRLLSDGDSVGASDCEIRWMSPEKVYEQHEVGLHAGESHTFDSFAREYSEVGVADDLLLPAPRWTEKDPGPNYRPPVGWDGPILPGKLGPLGESIAWVSPDDGDGINGSDCSGWFNFTVKITLRTYHPSQL
jgi:hypothetical protein